MFVAAPCDRSERLFPPDRLNKVATEIGRRGPQIEIHVIGDGAVRTAIYGYDAACAAIAPCKGRQRIEHVEVIDPLNVPAGTLDITASLQPPRAPAR